MATTLISSEREPLIGTSHSTDRIPEHPPLSKTIRPFRVKPLLCLIVLLVITLILIFVISPQHHHDSTPNVEWVRMEQGHRHKNHVPSTWSLKEECDDDHVFTITLAVKQQNVDKLDSLISEVSDPENKETFHQYWTPEEVRSYFKPSEESLDAVLLWLETSGFTQDNDKVQLVGPYGNIIKVSVTCSQANELLNTNYMFYENKQKDALHLRARNGEYSIPKTVFAHIDFVTPTIRFPLRQHTLKVDIMSAKAQTPKGDKKQRDNTEIYNSPKRLFEMYQMTAAVSNIMDADDIDTSTCRQSVLSLIDEFYDDSDLEAFWREFEVYPESEVERVPSTQPQGFGSEAELDTQYITSIGRGIYTYVYYVDDEVDPFMGVTEAIFDTEIPPFVISISYGAEESALGEVYAQRSNDELGKLALIGTTVLASSGDAGVFGDDSECADGEYIASFPASSPYVTAVGGTQKGKIPDDLDDTTGEIAWAYSGGGFSEYFETPSWQKKTVKSYFAQDGITFPSSSRYNAEGRAYPDISAQSVDFAVALEGEVYLVSGTSASSPTVAGMISMINYARIQRDKAPLGFLNPVLYKKVYQKQDDYDYYFNDVTSGYNLGCEENDGVEFGFYTAAGWDPVTGCGTPKFQRLYEALLKIK